MKVSALCARSQPVRPGLLHPLRTRQIGAQISRTVVYAQTGAATPLPPFAKIAGKRQVFSGQFETVLL